MKEYKKYLNEMDSGNEIVSKWLVINQSTGDFNPLLLVDKRKAFAMVSSYNDSDYDRPYGGEGGWGAFEVKVAQKISRLVEDK